MDEYVTKMSEESLFDRYCKIKEEEAIIIDILLRAKVKFNVDFADDVVKYMAKDFTYWNSWPLEYSIEWLGKTYDITQFSAGDFDHFRNY